MPNETWRDAARAVAQRRADEGREMNLSGDDLRAYVNAGYPFGERAYYPYHVWLQELKRAIDPSTGKQPTQQQRELLDAWNAGKPIHVESEHE